MKFKKADKEGLFKSIFTAYFILLLHVFLLAGVGLTVVLFKGVYHYLPWIMAALGLTVVLLALLIYRRMKVNAVQIRDILSVPEFKDRAVEIRLLGGLASFNIKAKEPGSGLLLSGPGGEANEGPLLLETGMSRTERKIQELNTLYEKGIITAEELKQARQAIIQG